MKSYLWVLFLMACGTNEIAATKTFQTADLPLILATSLEFGEHAAQAKHTMELTPLVYVDDIETECPKGADACFDGSRIFTQNGYSETYDCYNKVHELLHAGSLAVFQDQDGQHKRFDYLVVGQSICRGYLK